MNRVSRLLLGLCLITPTATMAAAPESPDPELNLELLEFLGEWDGESEAWLQQQKLDDEKSAATPKAEVKRDE